MNVGEMMKHLIGNRGASCQDGPSPIAELAEVDACDADPTIGAIEPLGILGEKLLDDDANVWSTRDSANDKQFPETD